MRKTRRLLASLCATGLLAVGVTAPAASAQPVVTGGLVNVTIVDLADVEIREVQVAVNAAANICDLDIITDTEGNITDCTAVVSNRQRQ
jgi:hypothetical protein